MFALSYLTPPTLLALLALTGPLGLYSLINFPSLILEWDLFSPSSHQLRFTLLLDPPSLIFASTILLIAANVLKFATSYIHSDPFLQRFTALVILFVLSIFFLIFIPNLIFLLLGWDGLGITSFLLVIYFQTPAALGAGIITALINRLGDAFLLISIALLLNQGHWTTPNTSSEFIGPIIPICLTLAAITKSAQIPFSRWLPAAIAAPTPVSALVHSSTLVTAGVFLLFRFYPFLSSYRLFSPCLLLVAALTILIAGLSAIVESDLKKIIALSTLSQLGVILSTIGLGLPTLAFFHLITHALFKALLFISAGSLIHHFSHTQDLRTITNSAHQAPITSSSILVASLALCGTPFLSGFYSKDLILEILTFNPINLLIFIIFAAATILTTAYSVRLALSLLWSSSSFSPLHNTHDEDPNLTLPILTLSTAAICVGRIINWMFTSPIPHPNLPSLYKILPLIFIVLGAGLSWALFNLNTPRPLKNHPTNHIYTRIWFLTPLTSQFILPAPLELAAHTTHSLDHSWLEYLIRKGWPQLIGPLSRHLQHPQSSITNSQLTAATILLLPLFLVWNNSLNSKANRWSRLDETSYFKWL